MGLESFNGRYVHIGQKIRVYRNLNKGQLTILDTTGLVLAHADFLMLNNVRFIVQMEGLRQSRITGVRNIHAFAEGILADYQKKRNLEEIWDSFSYNPFQNNTFVDELTGFPIVHASKVYLEKNKSFYLT